MSTTAEPTRIATAAPRYGNVAVAFHWAMFVLVILVGVLGLLHDSWPKSTQSFWINVHALAGLTLWVILFARIGWRASHAPPPPPPGSDPLLTRLADKLHIALYVLLFITPILGIITFVFHGRVFDFGVFQVNAGIKSNRAIFHPTEDIHGYLAYALFGLAGLHAAAALWHRFVRQDGILARMWPWAATR